KRIRGTAQESAGSSRNPHVSFISRREGSIAHGLAVTCSKPLPVVYDSPLLDGRSEFMTAIDFAAFVDELAVVSGQTIRPVFRSALSVENKSHAGGFDPVTAADRAAEAAMRALIKKTFPAHGIVGEEFPAEQPDAEYVWILDPIDGTKSFI